MRSPPPALLACAILAQAAAGYLEAQSDNEHGVRDAQPQTAYLVKPVEFVMPPLPDHVEDFQAYAQWAMDLQQQALAAAGGAPLDSLESGKHVILPPRKPVPRLILEHFGSKKADVVLRDLDRTVSGCGSSR